MDKTTAYAIGATALVVLGACIPKLFDWSHLRRPVRVILVLALVGSLCTIYLLRNELLPDQDHDYAEVAQRVSSAQIALDEVKSEKELLYRYPEREPYLSLRLEINIYIRRHLRAENYLRPAKKNKLYRSLLIQALDSNAVLYQRIKRQVAALPAGI